MKKRNLFFLCFLFCLLLCACGKASPPVTEPEVYTVEFDSLNGTLVDKQTLSAGEKLAPVSSTRGGYQLIGWCPSKAGAESLTGQPWDFDKQTVNESITLYAMWQTEEYRMFFDMPQDAPYSITATDSSGTTLQHGAKITVKDEITLHIVPEQGYIPGELTVNSAEKRYSIRGNVVNNIREDITVSATVTKVTPQPVEELVDFVIDVESGRKVRVLQFTDTQIIDAAQARPGRTGVDAINWATDRMDARLFDYMREIVREYRPDLILITGDLVYGEFDDNGTSFLRLIEVMDSFGIPWAPVFGNHDNESKKGVDWQCQQLENAKHCLFKQGTLTGNGNYSIGIVQGGQLVRTFYMLDSGGCLRNPGLGADQIAWYTGSINTIKALHPDTRASLAFHIQMEVWKQAFAVNGMSDTKTYDFDKDASEETFGYVGSGLKTPWDDGFLVWNGLKELEIVDSVFVGHEHSNSASIEYEGIRLAYGLKTGTYDRANYLLSDGSLAISYNPTLGTPVIGGTAIEFDASGELVTYHIYN